MFIYLKLSIKDSAILSSESVYASLRSDPYFYPINSYLKEIEEA